MEDPAPEVVELRGGDSDVEHEEGDRDREHAVAERLRAAGIPASAHVGLPGT